MGGRFEVSVVKISAGVLLLAFAVEPFVVVGAPGIGNLAFYALLTIAALAAALACAAAMRSAGRAAIAAVIVTACFVMGSAYPQAALSALTHHEPSGWEETGAWIIAFPGPLIALAAGAVAWRAAKRVEAAAAAPRGLKGSRSGDL